MVFRELEAARNSREGRPRLELRSKPLELEVAKEYLAKFSFHSFIPLSETGSELDCENLKQLPEYAGVKGVDMPHGRMLASYQGANAYVVSAIFSASRKSLLDTLYETAKNHQPPGGFAVFSYSHE